MIKEIPPDKIVTRCWKCGEGFETTEAAHEHVEKIHPLYQQDVDVFIKHMSMIVRMMNGYPVIELAPDYRGCP